MSTKDYMDGRRKYQRPQALLFSDDPGTIVDGAYIPQGLELGSDSISIPENYSEFLILSDHNRAPISVKPIRIEQRQRTINGRMRSSHIADKMSITVSWQLLPSRAFPDTPMFGENGKSALDEYTVDGGAGGVELLNWYENHYGSFYVYLAYDKYNEFGSNQYNHLNQYNQVVEMFIADFSYSIEKRGSSNHDLWNISMTLEEA